MRRPFFIRPQSSSPGAAWEGRKNAGRDDDPRAERFLAAEFPQAFYPESGLSIEAVWDGCCLVRQAFREVSLRPGGTISGPTMMALADVALYVAVLAAIGPVPLAVTINLNMRCHAG